MPISSSPRLLAMLVIACLLALVPSATLAQDATPMNGDDITAVATGLSAPRGFTWGPDGVIYVAQSGPGNTEAATGIASSVVKIVDGCPVPVASGLPSTFDPFRDALGPMDVQFVGDQLFVLQTATGEYGSGSPTPPMPNGIYTAGSDGSISLWLDLTSYIDSNPPTNMPGDYNELGEPYRFLYDDGSDLSADAALDGADAPGFWLIDSNRGLVFFIDMDKTITLIADLSLGHPVLTALERDGEGGVYIGNLTPAPHPDGGAQVVRVDKNGNVEQVWSNLTTVTGLALDSAGTLYAIEMATGNGGPDGMRPGTGRLLRQTGSSSYEVVAYGLEYPIDLEIGPDGDFYASMPAFGSNAQSGMILRIPADASELTVDLAKFDGGMCAGATPYKAPAAVPPGSPTPPPTNTPVPAATPVG